MAGICKGCGGIIGRDCFNPMECEIISISMNSQQSSDNEAEIYYLKQHINLLIERIERSEEITKSLNPI